MWPDPNHDRVDTALSSQYTDQCNMHRWSVKMDAIKSSINFVHFPCISFAHLRLFAVLTLPRSLNHFFLHFSGAHILNRTKDPYFVSMVTRLQNHRGDGQTGWQNCDKWIHACRKKHGDFNYLMESIRTAVCHRLSSFSYSTWKGQLLSSAMLVRCIWKLQSNS